MTERSGDHGRAGRLRGEMSMPEAIRDERRERRRRPTLSVHASPHSDSPDLATDTPDTLNWIGGRVADPLGRILASTTVPCGMAE